MTVGQIKEWIQEHKFLDPMWDESFKILLGNPEHPEFLIDLLNNILRLQGDGKIQSTLFRIPSR